MPSVFIEMEKVEMSNFFLSPMLSSALTLYKFFQTTLGRQQLPAVALCLALDGCSHYLQCFFMVFSNFYQSFAPKWGSSSLWYSSWCHLSIISFHYFCRHVFLRGHGNGLLIEPISMYMNLVMTFPWKFEQSWVSYLSCLCMDRSV